jgi:integrase
MDQEGIRMKVAQELLRHADIQTTMNVYTGAMEKDKEEAAYRMAKRMLQKKPQAAFTANLPCGGDPVN